MTIINNHLHNHNKTEIRASTRNIQYLICYGAEDPPGATFHPYLPEQIGRHESSIRQPKDSDLRRRYRGHPRRRLWVRDGSWHWQSKAIDLGGTAKIRHDDEGPFIFWRWMVVVGGVLRFTGGFIVRSLLLKRNLRPISKSDLWWNKLYGVYNL